MKPRRIIIIFSFSGILAVHLIRSMSISGPACFQFLLGVLPNFFAAAGLPFLFHHLAAGRPALNTIRFEWIVAIVFVILTVWEFIQWQIWNYPADLNDGIATFAGCLLSGILYRLFRD